MGRKRANQTLVAFLVLILALTGVWLVTRINRASTDTAELAPIGPAPAFQLIDQSGTPFSSEALLGKVTVANFMYTNCTDICPLLTATMVQIQTQLKNSGIGSQDVMLLSFTTDPARDTPQVLNEYAKGFNADLSFWQFLTGPESDVLDTVTGGFHLGVTYSHVKEGPDGESVYTSHETGDEHPDDYEVFHSGRFVLIDKTGNIRAYYSFPDFEAADVVQDVKQLLKET